MITAIILIIISVSALIYLLHQRRHIVELYSYLIESDRDGYAYIVTLIYAGLIFFLIGVTLGSAIVLW